MFSVNHIRSVFLDYFHKHGHNIAPSSPLIPHNDPTLMFTNSGMVQFKNVFTGDEKRPYSRATTSQKSVRAGGKHNDLDNVGYTARHHTFFEMLGNFSFGDYFKEDAIYFAWECLTKEFALPKDKLYVTVFHTDDEAIKLWKKIAGLDDSRIIPISTNDNFWSMGDTGPCGPCSEIFFDHGEKIAGGLPGTPDQDGDRYIEIWNLVFMQYEQLASGERKSLPKPSIDTGMGLERIAAVLQHVHNNYEIDLFTNLINTASDIVRVEAEGKALTSYRVLADHLRSCSFLIADGVMPSNEGRGYVLRRIMRRAMRHAHQLGCKDPLMHQLFPSLVSEMGQAYPELIRAQKLISDTLFQEEIRFKQTLGKGLKLLDEELIKSSKSHIFKGETAFKLYDTYGFPLDLTQDILKNKNIEVDVQAFNSCMQEQKTRARAAWAGSGEQATNEIWFNIYQTHGATEFLGYNNNQDQAIILEVIKEGEDKQIIITNQTPFYGESGGQMGDIGTITSADNQIFKVIDTKKFLGKIHAHYVMNSNFKPGDLVNLAVDLEYRNNLRIHHSATHLLHLALRQTLGEHLTQKGSLVAADRLRFDFSHSKSLSTEELIQVENLVNKMIRENSESYTKLMSTEEAISSGAMALFGEKYDEEVRVVSMGNSTELCGGTHVKATGDIAIFKITSEGAIASGIRRIEAVCGQHALNYIYEQEKKLNQISYLLKTPKAELIEKISTLLKDNKSTEDELVEAKKKLLVLDPNFKNSQYDKITLIEKFVDNIDVKDLRNFVEHLCKANKHTIVVAGSKYNNKTSLIVGISNDLPEYDASTIVKMANELAGGQGGGGKRDIAQAGGFDFQKVEAISTYLESLLSK
ncbi:MAG: alanine--tRNA ligase [Rickettsiales bacterium]